MVLFHLDRNNSLKDGQSLELLPFNQLAPEIAASKFLQPFSNGISVHAIHYLNNNCNLLDTFRFADGHANAVFDAVTVPSLIRNKNHIDCQIIEMTFEIVRRAYFPDKPSRFSSIFAVDSLDEFSKWPELILKAGSSEKHNVFSIEANDCISKFDSNWLKGGLILGLNQEFKKYYFGYMPTAVFDFAFNYWSEIPSDSPRWEYLVELPIQKVSWVAAY